jgi:hypothetical protein
VTRSALAFPAVESADETADGIADEEDNLLAPRHVSECEMVLMKNNLVVTRIQVRRETRNDGGSTGLSNVEKVYNPPAL